MLWLLLGLGLVLVIEGVALALAPSRIEDVLEAIRNIPVETRRLLGLGSVALGVLLVWIARSNGL